MRLAAALGASLALLGCLGVGAEGEETLVLRNALREPVRLLLEVTALASQIVVVDEDVSLGPGETRELVVALRAGPHEAQVGTSTGIVDRVPFEVPSRGDSTIEVVVGYAGATLRITGS